MSSERIVAALLDGNALVPARRLVEASVRRPRGGHRWLAVYTGVQPGTQVWKSTGLRDRDAALVKALEWEKEARQHRVALGLKPRKPNIRVRRTRTGPSGSIALGVGPLSQAEVAAVLKLSVRGVRVIEKRALEKLRDHPALRQFWTEFSTGDRTDDPNLEERQETELTAGEIDALFGLVRTEEEQQAVAKLLAWIGSSEP